MLLDAQPELVEGLAHLDLLRVGLVAMKDAPSGVELGLSDLLGGLRLSESGCEEDLGSCAG